MDGELLCGILDKSESGATDYGLVHSVYELFGADVAGKLLGILSRLFTKFLQHRALTCRMDDLALTPDCDSKRTELLRKGRNLGTDGAVENFPSLSKLSKEDVPAALTPLLENALRDDSKTVAGLYDTSSRGSQNPSQTLACPMDFFTSSLIITCRR
ncbi:hypothetical protein BJ138DRAFT_406374 [Hygrophoropsis aurantiaca]|uniref:Uncharacterized protein n=1 Tax=Hygrophoropsis aurantiaca TaxID=72124 RepID=A0ACB8A3X7_9AGAM|nr:hypothetical protein BJ138DRAFT_406374 [Hygrophoropsis aurantiaca]